MNADQIPTEKSYRTECEPADAMPGWEIAFWAIKDGYAEVTAREDLRWRKPDMPEGRWVSIIGSTVIVTGDNSRQWLGLTINEYELGTEYDRNLKNHVEVRKFTRRRSAIGEPIPPLARLDAWRFFTDYSPDPRQMSQTEYAAFLTDHAALIAREREFSESHARGMEEESQRQAALDYNRAHPEELVAKLVSLGVRQALENLNLKGGKA